jgi:PilZ domain
VLPDPKALKNTGRERRECERHVVDSAASVFLLDVRARIEGRVMDVSLSGCRIRSKERFPTGIYRRVEVEFSLDGIAFRLAGVVQAVHDRHTIGIRLLNVSERKREQLAILIGELEAEERRENGADDGPRPDVL